jgi:hypothetical protein
MHGRMSQEEADAATGLSKARIETTNGLGLKDVSRPEQGTSHRVAHETCQIMDIQLLHDAMAVGLHGLDADPEKGRDLLRGLCFGSNRSTCACRDESVSRARLPLSRCACTTVSQMAGLR